MTRRLAKKLLAKRWSASTARLSDVQIEAAGRRLARGRTLAQRARIGERVIGLKSAARLMRKDFGGFLDTWVTPRYLRAWEEDGFEAAAKISKESRL